MAQDARSEHDENGVRGGHCGVIVTTACDGKCEACLNALPNGGHMQIGAEMTRCRLGWKYLQTDALPSDLHGAGKTDALGDAAKEARANRAGTPEPADPA